MKKIAVLSAGNGGQALAADLSLRGHDVALYDLPAFASVIEAIKRRGNTIELQNKIVGTATLRLVTTDIAEALEGAEVVYFTAPSYGQKAFFELVVPALSDGQVIVLMPGNYGTLALKAALRAAGKDVQVAETDNLPYACAAIEPGVINVRGIKKTVTLAAFPASDYAKVEAAVEGAFCTGWHKGANVLVTSMSGVNMVVHCAPMLANAGRIESEGGKFEFYYAGMTPNVCRLIEATDRERLAVARAYGLDLVSTAQTFRNQYGVQGETLYEVLQANPAFAGFAPKTLHHRFLTEDTPYSMVPMAALGKLAGVATPIMDALIVLLGEMLGENYAETGQTAKRMGLDGMTPEQILDLVSA